MLALTSLSIVSALAPFPTRLENFTLEICKLRRVSYTEFKNYMRLHVTHFSFLRSQVPLVEGQLGTCVRLQTKRPDLLREVVSLILHRANFDVELCNTIFVLRGSDVRLQLFNAVLLSLYI